jgi:lysophospholipase L1-like esterase
MMGLLGYAIPTDGVTIGSVNMTFPSPQEVMKGSVEYTNKPFVDIDQVFFGMEAIQRQIEEEQASSYIKARRKALSHKYSPTYPNDNIEWIFSLFETLEKASEQKVRIIHYGDSQIEEDRMSNYLRTAMQDTFGGYGVGLIPAIQSVPTSSFGQKCSKSLKRYLVYGTQDMRMEERNYGPLGQTALLTDTATFSFYRLNYSKTRPNTKYFNKITILLDQVKRPTNATLIIKGVKTTKTANVGDRRITFNLPDSSTRASIFMSGEALIHGFMVDGGTTGVQFDNAAMRGCSGTIFTSITNESLRNYYTQNTVPLIIMQFGGNRVPYTKTDKGIASYCEQLTRQIEYLRRISPQSKILFIGPSDMSTNINGSMQTYPHLEKLINSLRQMCLNNDVAYWDLYGAMGGENSMTKWVNSNPPLAGSDHIHFTYAGSNRASEMLWEGIMQAYQLYKTKEQ